MSKEKEIQRQLQHFKRQNATIFPLKVVSVNKDNKTIAAKDETIEHPEIRLNASVIEGQNKSMVCYPKVGSFVQVGIINNNEVELVVLAMDNVESFELNIEDVELKITNNGFHFQKENETLKQLIADLIAMIEQLKFNVATPTGNGTTTNLIAPNFTNIKNRFNQFLSNN